MPRSGRVMFIVGRLVGICSPARDNDGHATKRPSTSLEHRRRLIQPTRKPTDLTNPSTESDQVHHGRARGLPRDSDARDTSGEVDVVAKTRFARSFKQSKQRRSLPSARLASDDDNDAMMRLCGGEL